jgi:hypothetical protein
VVIPAPTPLVFTPEDGYDNVNHTCVAAAAPVTGATGVYVSVSGFVN